MITEDRDKYLQKCKARALGYLPNVPDALACMLQHLRQHDEFIDVSNKLAPLALHIALQHDVDAARKFITGFK